jgi:hypothetical protein
MLKQIDRPRRAGTQSTQQVMQAAQPTEQDTHDSDNELQTPAEPT